MNTRELQRRQLDARLMGMPRESTPKGGWIRTIRRALGMTMAQLGGRLRVSAPGIADLEVREANETISMSRLRAAADALGCDLVVAFVPRVPLTEMVRRQAMNKAQQQSNRLLHTMRLENQGDGVSNPATNAEAIERLMSGRSSRLWD